MAWRESHKRSVRLADTVHQRSAECMSEAVEAFLLYPRCLENPVVPFAEVDRPGVAALLVAHERGCGAEIAFLAQLPYRLRCGLIQTAQRVRQSELLRFSGGCFGLADLDLSAGDVVCALSPAHFLDVLAYFQVSALQIDVAVEKAKQFACA